MPTTLLDYASASVIVRSLLCRSTYLAVAGVATLSVLSSGCTPSSSNEPGSGVASSTPSTSTPSGSPAELTTFANLEDLAEAVSTAGFGCELEYEGLVDDTGLLSLCVVDEAQLQLRIWNDEADLAEFVASEFVDSSTVYGANWSIGSTEVDLAQNLVQPLGGQSG